MSEYQPHKTLYIKNNNGKIQMWRQYIIKNSDDDVELFTEHGLIDGKKQLRPKKIDKTKKKRSKYEEACEIARSTWESKVNKEGYTDDLKKAGTQLIIKPMLAHKYNDEKKCVFPCLVQGKCDGNRCLSHIENNKVLLMSRKMTQFNNFHHIRNELMEIYKKYKLPETFYFDGELYTHNLPFNDINGTIKLNEINDNEKTLKMEYYIYDCFDLNNMMMPMDERWQLIHKMIKNNKFLKIVDGFVLNTEKDIKKVHDKFVENKYEGLILRNLKSVYHLDKRSNDLLKYKEFESEEFEIIGFDKSTDGKNRVIWICKSGNKSFNVAQDGSDEFCSKLYDEGNEHIGKMLIVKFQEYTDKTNKIPRFPRGIDFRNPDDM